MYSHKLNLKKFKKSKSGPKTFVVALGGNSILRSDQKGTIEEQYENIHRTCEQLVKLVRVGHRIVITHGNGPQIGNLLLAVANKRDIHAIPALPIDICVAATEGYMGFMIQNTLANHLRQARLRHNITTVVTEVVVDKQDPAFKNPTKPIGPFYRASVAKKLQHEMGCIMIEDSARGYRRVVPSPMPVQIQQSRIIKSMLATGEIVIAIGGGGIPVIREKNGNLRAIEAVIDKDQASAQLAIEVGADVLLFLTSVESVFVDFGRPTQRPLTNLSITEARRLLEAKQFGIGSMEPKIRAAIHFLSDTARSLTRQECLALITLPETMIMALEGKTGTKIAMD